MHGLLNGPNGDEASGLTRRHKPTCGGIKWQQKGTKQPQREAEQS